MAPKQPKKSDRKTPATAKTTQSKTKSKTAQTKDEKDQALLARAAADQKRLAEKSKAANKAQKKKEAKEKEEATASRNKKNQDQTKLNQHFKQLEQTQHKRKNEDTKMEPPPVEIDLTNPEATSPDRKRMKEHDRPPDEVMIDASGDANDPITMIDGDDIYSDEVFPPLPPKEKPTVTAASSKPPAASPNH
jgi:hypothetical protein